MSWLPEYLHMLHDPAHILFEFTLEAVSATIGLIIGRGWLRKHDREVHGS